MIRALVLLYAKLSLLAVGGVITVLPEMQRTVVQTERWMDAPAFAASFALAQAAPGPNMLIATLVGLRVGGVPGALAATAAMIGPSSVLAFAAGHAWRRFRDRRWRRVTQAALVPVTVGLVSAAAALLAGVAATGWRTGAMVAASAGFCTLSRRNPLLMLAAGAGLGAAGFL